MKTIFLCKRFDKTCLYADEHGFCRAITCKEPPDGAYLELFVIKDGERYNYKTVSIRELTLLLTDSVADGIEKLCK